MGKPPANDQQLEQRVAALEVRADETDAMLSEMDTTLEALDARVTALEAAATAPPEPTDPPVISGGPIIPPPVVDHTLPVPEPQPPEPPTTGRAVTILLGGQSHLFTQEGGTDLGAYTDPRGRFTQHCIAARCTTLPAFSVMFRPDADGTREEVVFELGAIWTTDALANLGAYTAVISKDGTELARVEAPKHNYYGRWRWQSAPRPVVNNVADLIAAGLLPHYDASVGGGHTPPSQERHYAGPMDLAGIEPYMPSTGGRDDIGLVTECQGDYLCTQSPAALSSLMAQLEGCGSLPWHFRDENTGAPIDIWEYPRCSSRDPNDGNPQPFIPANWVDCGITLDTSHEPDLGYVPFLLTGDPYALEELQYTVTFNYVCLAPDAKGWYNLTGAVRAHAWSLRCMARAAKVTPDTVPQWLLPKAHFRKLLDGNRDLVAGYANSSETLFANLNCLADPRWGTPPEANIPPDCSNAPWWEDYEICVQTHLIEMGFDDWLPNFQWKVRNIIDRCSGTSGWNRAWSFPYKMAVRPTADAPFATDWADAWNMNVQMGNCAESSEDAIPEGDLSYPQQGAAALAMAKRLGTEGAEAAYAWLRAELDRLSTAQNFVNYRWSVA